MLDTASDLVAARGVYAARGFQKVASVRGEPWLPRGVLSERWQLDLTAGAATPRRSWDDPSANRKSVDPIT